jgi:hypothetical protein
LKVQSSAGIVVADAVLYRLDPDLVLLCEGKSGRNVEEEQARKYAGRTPARFGGAGRCRWTLRRMRRWRHCSW